MSVCPQVSCGTIWPSNSPNELLYRQQRLFNRDSHNHDQVLDEKVYNLPLDIPANHQAIRKNGPFTYCDATTGTTQRAPFSTDNVMHQQWEGYRLGTNLNTPWGSDSDIFFDQVPPPRSAELPLYNPTNSATGVNQQGYSGYLDWLDRNKGQCTPLTMDQKVSQCCVAQGSTHCTYGADGSKGVGVNAKGKVCSQTCVDWWTNRVVDPQGSMQSAAGGVSGGCPWGTTRALTCYPCRVHQSYVRGSANDA